MKNKIKFIYIFFFTLILKNLYSYDIIRDPIFENYFDNISKELNLNKVNVYLVDNKNSNAFVINQSIYITTGLIKAINNEDTLKAIYLHEYGHLIKNHLQTKKIKIQESGDRNNYLNLFSIGLAIISGNSDIGIGSSITLNSNLINELSKHSVNFEIEADNFMIDQIKKYEISTSELISFLKKIPKNENNYFKTHPNNIDRINNLIEINSKNSINSNKFNWIKSKYSNNSEIKNFNEFFKKLEKGIFNHDEKLMDISEYIIKYEAFKRGILIKDWEINFKNLLEINDSSFLKIEYINYLLDNNIDENYYLIEDLKYDEEIMNENFYYYIFGKYHDKIGKSSISNFYFCQFYKSINSKNKADFFCDKYDIKDIPILDKSYALFK